MAWLRSIAYYMDTGKNIAVRLVGYKTCNVDIWDRYSRSPPMDTYIPHMALAFWMRDEHIDLSSSASLAAEGLAGLDYDSSLSTLNRSQTLVQLKTYEDFTQEAIIDGVGLEAFFRRLELAISHQHRPEELCVRDYDVWNLLAGIIVAPKVLAYLVTHGILDSLMGLHAALSHMPGRSQETSQVFSAWHNAFR